MKKTLVIFLCISMILTVAGCNSEKSKKENKTADKTTTTTETTTESNVDYNDVLYGDSEFFSEISSQDKNYVIRTNEDYQVYYYEVYDNNKDIIDKGFHGDRGGVFSTKNGDILVVEMGYGGTNTPQDYKVYDVETGRVSRRFTNTTAAFYDATIAYFDYIEEEEKHIIVVRDVFDIDKAYKEYDANFTEGRYLYDIKFSKDGSEIHVEYYDRDTESDKKKVIELD